MSEVIDTAIVLAAGLGTRMRPLTDAVPKPLVRLAGRALIDHALDRLAVQGVGSAVVNVHYKAHLIEQHLASRRTPRIVISDERGQLLETGGGVRKALPLLGCGPFLIHNSDSVWIEPAGSNLARLVQAFESARMDGLLLLARRASSLGYSGEGDFALGADGRISRRKAGQTADFVFAGVSIASPRLMRDTPEGAFSLNRVWDRALEEHRLYGVVLEGTWMHVGDPAALAAAEALIATGAPA